MGADDLVQVTIVWQDCEIGYGVGEMLDYAKMEARASVDSIYFGVEAEWQYIF